MPRDPGLAPRAVGVKEIPVDELKPNPHNPRMLFDKAPLQVLKESVQKVGILVPLTVYFDAKRKYFVILDGQRRWIVAKELDLTVVPVNEVDEPSLVQNIVTMFQIHKLREDWELMPTALKLELLMEELQERNDKKLAALTGLDRAVVARCKKLLDFPRRYQDMMLDPDPDKRVKADFFIELHAVRNDQAVNRFSWYKRDEFTDRMLERYETRSGMKSVTDFRIVKQHITNARRAENISSLEPRFRDFVQDHSTPIEHLAIKAAEVDAEARKLVTDIKGLTKQLRDLDAARYYGEDEVWKSLEALLRLIRKRLVEADRRGVE